MVSCQWYGIGEKRGNVNEKTHSLTAWDNPTFYEPHIPGQ